MLRTFLSASFFVAAVCSGAQAADYPFVGAWVRADRTCSPTSTRERIYTGRDVISSRGRCVIHKVVAGGNATFELFEKCERPNERSGRIRETIRMMGQDGMTLTRQTTRLKLSRSVRFNRCPVPAAVKPGR